MEPQSPQSAEASAEPEVGPEADGDESIARAVYAAEKFELFRTRNTTEIITLAVPMPTGAARAFFFNFFVHATVGSGNRYCKPPYRHGPVRFGSEYREFIVCVSSSTHHHRRRCRTERIPRSLHHGRRRRARLAHPLLLILVGHGASSSSSFAAKACIETKCHSLR